MKRISLEDLILRCFEGDSRINALGTIMVDQIFNEIFYSWFLGVIPN